MGNYCPWEPQRDTTSIGSQPDVSHPVFEQHNVLMEERVRTPLKKGATAA